MKKLLFLLWICAISLCVMAQDKKKVTVGGVTFNMVKVEGGSFTIGATGEQGTAVDPNEKPPHSVTLDAFYIAEFEVTQKLWAAVMGNNPSMHKGDDQPVEMVSWDDVQSFIAKLSQMTGMKFRLPTEAEWEFAARGGKKTKGYKFSGGNDAQAVAWCEDNSGKVTHPVGQKQPNELGLYDMSGNVWEYCQDCFGPYSEAAQKNPLAVVGNMRTSRGGGSGSSAWACRVSYRSGDPTSLRFYGNGFRLAM